MLILINKKTRYENFNLLKEGNITLLQASQQFFRTDVPKNKITVMISGIEVIQYRTPEKLSMSFFGNTIVPVISPKDEIIYSLFRDNHFESSILPGLCLNELHLTKKVDINQL